MKGGGWTASAPLTVLVVNCLEVDVSKHTYPRSGTHARRNDGLREILEWIQRYRHFTITRTESRLLRHGDIESYDYWLAIITITEREQELRLHDMWSNRINVKQRGDDRRAG